MNYVYFIRSQVQDWVYVGSTTDLRRRFGEHNIGAVRATKARKPYRLIYYEAYENLDQARKRERDIKISRSEKEKILERLKK